MLNFTSIKKAPGPDKSKEKNVLAFFWTLIGRKRVPFNPPVGLELAFPELL